MNPVNWFEIPVEDMGRAKEFYSKVLGQTLSDMPSPVPGMSMASFPMEQGAPSATGALVKVGGLSPRRDGTVVYFACADLDAALDRVPAAGGEVLTPKTAIGDYGFIAHAVDTEGNRIGLHGEK